jgi:hypothetical protein
MLELTASTALGIISANLKADVISSTGQLLSSNHIFAGSAVALTNRAIAKAFISTLSSVLLKSASVGIPGAAPILGAVAFPSAVLYPYDSVFRTSGLNGLSCYRDAYASVTKSLFASPVPYSGDSTGVSSGVDVATVIPLQPVVYSLALSALTTQMGLAFPGTGAGTISVSGVPQIHPLLTGLARCWSDIITSVTTVGAGAIGAASPLTTSSSVSLDSTFSVTDNLL